MFKRRTVIISAIICSGFLLRILHLLSMPANPQSYHPAADEDFYIRFGMDVAFGELGMTADFIVMDPLYGYFLGLMFFLFGKNLFLVYLVQTLVDTVTLWLVYLAGKEISGSQRVGLIADFFYAFAATTIFYSTTILKPTWVAFYLVLWLYLSLLLWRSNTLVAWLGYGLLLGLGIALRSNLLVLVIAGLLIVPAGNAFYCQLSKARYGVNILLLCGGLAIVLSLLAYRNALVGNHWSFFPPNSGVVLHQIYNSENPEGQHVAQSVVASELPSEIFHDYRIEAERRNKRPLDLYQVSAYWRKLALKYVVGQPLKNLQNIIRKTVEFTAYKEVANNRAINESEYFSPVLAFLPRPFGWLLVFGLPGLILITMRSAKGWLLISAVATFAVTFAFFYPLARFRFPIVPILAIGSAVTIEQMLNYRQSQRRTLMALAVGMILIATLTVYSGNRVKEPPKETFMINWAWGFLKMGDFNSADALTQQILQQNPRNEKALEVAAYLALLTKKPSAAVGLYQRALQTQPKNHLLLFNYAIALEQSNHLARALAAIDNAIDQREMPDYLFRRALLLD